MTTPSTTGTFRITQGDTGRPLPFTCYDGNGNVVPLTTPGTTVAFQMTPAVGGPLKVNAPASITSLSGGAVSYQWVPADVDTAGAWTGVFVVTVPGQGVETYPADGIEVLISPNLLSARGPVEGPCFPWADPSLVRTLVPGIDPNMDPTVWVLAASEILYALTGRQFPGVCSATVRPEGTSCHCGCHGWGGPLWGGGLSWGYSTTWPLDIPGWWGFPGQLCPPSVYLGTNVRDVYSVTIDGVVVGPATYRMDRRMGQLVRLADPTTGQNAGWPCCGQRIDLPASQPNTFEIAFSYGEDPPMAAVLACAVLAGHMALGANPATAGQCKLPQHVQTITRQGVTASFITDVTVILDKGYAGIPTVDAAIAAFNPHHLDRRARVFSPDVPEHWQVGP